MTWSPTRRSGHRRTGLAAGLLAALVLAGCSYDATELPQPEEVESSAGSPATPVVCDDATASYAPAGASAAAARAQLGNASRLVVGVSADTFQMGFNDPEDSTLKGFDIDFARRIADELGVAVQFRVISAAERIELLESGEIDLVARNMTVNCTRWEQVAFSAVYYDATQKVLVRKDVAADYDGPSTLAGKRVCAPAGSTSIDNITNIEPDVETVAAANHTGCLILFQAGDVDAITGDDTVLAGLAAQDPYAVVPEQTKLTDEPYGLAANSGDVALVRFVNAVLEEMRADGSWQRTYDTWLRAYLGKGSQPTPRYGR